MSATDHRATDSTLTDRIEDAAVLVLLFAGAALAITMVVLMVLF